MTSVLSMTKVFDGYWIDKQSAGTGATFMKFLVILMLLLFALPEAAHPSGIKALCVTSETPVPAYKGESPGKDEAPKTWLHKGECFPVSGSSPSDKYSAVVISPEETVWVETKRLERKEGLRELNWKEELFLVSRTIGILAYMPKRKGGPDNAQLRILASGDKDFTLCNLEANVLKHCKKPGQSTTPEAWTIISASKDGEYLSGRVQIRRDCSPEEELPYRAKLDAHADSSTVLVQLPDKDQTPKDAVLVGSPGMLLDKHTWKIHLVGHPPFAAGSFISGTLFLRYPDNSQVARDIRIEAVSPPFWRNPELFLLVTNLLLCVAWVTKMLLDARGRRSENRPVEEAEHLRRLQNDLPGLINDIRTIRDTLLCADISSLNKTLSSVTQDISSIKSELSSSTKKWEKLQADLAEKTRQLEIAVKEKSKLEEQTQSCQKRLGQIFGVNLDSLEGMNPFLDTLEQRRAEEQQKVSELETNLEKCKNSLVFLNPEDKASVESLGRNFESIERTCRKIEKETAEFIRSLPPESDARKEFSPPVVSPHFSYWVRMISQELLKFSQKGVTGFPEIALQRCGETLSAQQIKSPISERFFYEAVADHWDKTLRQLQRFYQLGAWMKLDSEQVGRHRAAVGQLRQCQEELAASFAALGIRPLSLTFLEPVSEREMPYVLEEELRPLSVYFPLADSSQADKRRVILDVRTWAYLKENGQLWGGQKARLVISA